MTGLAQVLVDPACDVAGVKEKLGYDFFYMNHASLWLDVRVLLATVLHLLGVSGEIIRQLFRFPTVGTVLAVGSNVEAANVGPVFS
jgi:hypothetical protein